MASEKKGREFCPNFYAAWNPTLPRPGYSGTQSEIEKSGLEALATIGEGDLLKGRRFYQFILAMADFATRGGEFLPPEVDPALSEALSKIARSLRDSDEWCVAGLAGCSIVSYRTINASEGKSAMRPIARITSVDEEALAVSAKRKASRSDFAQGCVPSDSLCDFEANRL